MLRQESRSGSQNEMPWNGNMFHFSIFLCGCKQPNLSTFLKSAAKIHKVFK